MVPKCNQESKELRGNPYNLSEFSFIANLSCCVSVLVSKMSKRVDEGENSSPNPNDALVSTLSTMVQTLVRLEERMQRVEERQAAPAQP